MKGLKDLKDLWRMSVQRSCKSERLRRPQFGDNLLGRGGQSSSGATSGLDSHQVHPRRALSQKGLMMTSGAAETNPWLKLHVVKHPAPPAIVKRLDASARSAQHPGLSREFGQPCAIAQPRRRPMQRRDINAADAPAPAGQYTQAVEVTAATRTLYISGQVGVAADGSIPADAEAQSALAWRNLQAQLRAAGMGIENLVKITTIVPNPADIARGARRPRLGAGRCIGRRARSSSAASAIRPGRSRWRASRWPDRAPRSPVFASPGCLRGPFGPWPATRRSAARGHTSRCAAEPKRPCRVRAP